MILHGLSRLTDDSLLWLLPRLALIPWLLALPEGRTEVGDELGEVFAVGAGDEKDWGKKWDFSSPLCSCSVSAWQWLLRNKGGSGNWFRPFLTNERFTLQDYVRVSQIVFRHSLSPFWYQADFNKIALPMLCFTAAVFFENGMKSLGCFFSSLPQH